VVGYARVRSVGVVADLAGAAMVGAGSGVYFFSRLGDAAAGGRAERIVVRQPVDCPKIWNGWQGWSGR